MGKKPGSAEVEEPFILTGMVSLVAGTLWIWIRNDLFLQYFYQAELLALTHLVTLGFISSIMMGVLMRLVPMSLNIRARSKGIARVQFVLFFVGSLGMIFHFWLAEWSGLAWATLLVVAAGTLQIVNFRDLWRPIRQGNWVARHVGAALVYFVLAALLGALLGFNKALDQSFSLLGGRFTSNLFAHVHLAAVGWVTTMILGFELKLVPTTLGRERFLPVRFGALQIGTLGTVTGLLLDEDWVVIFAALLCVAILWHAVGPLRALLSGRAREWEALPLFFLVLTALIGMVLALGIPTQDDPLRGRVQLAYGYLGLLGWVALTITTVAFKLFPIWVWQERFQADFGKKPVPGMKDLYSHRLRVLSYALLALGVMGTVVGILVESPWTLHIAPGLVFAGVVAFAVNFVRMARWALLRLDYRPTEEEWEKFRSMFPGNG